jgi:serine/threonine protein kinase/Flp pilus assembly protein TadD
MVAAWRRGERPLAEEILARHPELGDDAAIRLIYEEVCLRREAGLTVDHEEIARRFPRWQEELEVLLDCQRFIESTPPRLEFPREGEVIAGFRLVLELGRGAAGRVFLAVQPSLADRPVVLKITPRGREEHLALARFQHMNIVPLYSEHVLQARNLQILCMPFLGGATLGQVLDLMKEEPPSKRTGKLLIDAIDKVQSRLPIAHQAEEPLRQFVAHCSYVEAVCAIGACLADGLQYAHERNLLHMDIKPSNVLLAGDGQPMLLDFHLAQRPIAAGKEPPLWAGGTPGYVSPEQWGVITAVREGRPVPDAVDRRADVYSLGALLYEALGGPIPDSPGAVWPPVCQFNSRVSPGLSDLVGKCLNPHPGARYRDAAALATDLRRHLSNLPLRGVANRSLTERWRKWRRRRPAALSRGLIVFILAASALLAAGSLGLSYRELIHDIDSALAQGRAFLALQEFSEAADTLKHGLSLCERTPGSARRREALAHELAVADRGVKIDELHRLAELIRFRYGVALPRLDEARSVIGLGRRIWEGRDRLIRPPAGEVGPAVDERMRADLIDLMVLWSELTVRFASAGEAATAKREALRVLAEVEALIGKSPSIFRQREAYAQQLSPETHHPEVVLTVSSAWEHFDLGKSYMRSGDLRRASQEFHVGLTIHPEDFWLNFYEGLCAYRLMRFDEAVNAFRVSIALSPKAAECHYNRGLAYQALGRFDLAVADYDRALKLNDHFTDAALNRGLIHHRLGNDKAARDDLNRALALAPGRKDRGIIHYNLALIDLADGDRESCAQNVRSALELGNPDAQALSQRLNR